MRIPTIKKQILQKFQKTANAIAKESENIVTKSFDTYYSKGSPEMYVRTGTLRGAKKAESQIGETEATITAGYDGGQISYSTGTFTGQQVLDATMSGDYGVLGDSSYDEKALQKVVEMADEKMASAFG